MLIYSNQTQYGTDENGCEIVFDWAREQGFSPEIRVEAFRKHVEEIWKVNWLDMDAVKARFDVENLQQACSPRGECGPVTADFGVYVLDTAAK
jgi:hypothetical protein